MRYYVNLSIVLLMKQPFTKQKHVCEVLYKLWYSFDTQQLTITTTSKILHIPLWLWIGSCHILLPQQTDCLKTSGDVPLEINKWNWKITWQFKGK